MLPMEMAEMESSVVERGFLSMVRFCLFVVMCWEEPCGKGRIDTEQDIQDGVLGSQDADVTVETSLPLKTEKFILLLTRCWSFLILGRRGDGGTEHPCSELASHESRNDFCVYLCQKSQTVEIFGIFWNVLFFHQPFRKRSHECIVVSGDRLIVAGRLARDHIVQRAGMEFRDCDFVALNREDGQAGHGQGVRYINTLKYRCHLQLRS